MPYLAIMARQGGGGCFVRATAVFVEDDGSAGTPMALENTPDPVTTDFAALDDLIGTTPASTVIVSWMGHTWLHLVGPKARERYSSHVDLAASFIAQHRHHVGLASFVCVDDATTAAGVAALVQQILSHGRLVWRTGSSNIERGFWIKSFFTSLKDLQVLSPPEWITEPVSITLADTALVGGR